MSSAMISAPQPEAAEAGLLTLKLGGNAIDAAITCALVQGVVDPQMCGIAGFGSLQVYCPGRDHYFIDFHGNAPGSVTDDMWADLIQGETPDGFGFILKDHVNDVGYQSVATPGSLKAYFEAQTKHGTMDWADVVAPAIEWAERGSIVLPQMAGFWNVEDGSGRVQTRERLRYSETGRAVYFNDDGSLKKLGQTIHNPDLANTLRMIAKDGADVFYRGEIAEQIASDMAGNGGLLTLEDLKQYETVKTSPLWGDYRGYQYATNQPPDGGIMLVQMLNILENFDLSKLGHNSTDYIRIVTEAMKRATSDKDNFVGDPAFFDVPVERLCEKGYAEELAESIRLGERASVERYATAESSKTTHVSVVDKQGNAVTMTHSLGMPSGVITKGLGFMYNGCMGGFDPRQVELTLSLRVKVGFHLCVQQLFLTMVDLTLSLVHQVAHRSQWAFYKVF
ncbi:MAG: gamma-glutamyltranspeptidase/glutathione hydrolase [Granulosicoccus sp.]|jgi:gamma-glutamyltranspeptidase/glutathione hydrolase